MHIMKKKNYQKTSLKMSITIICKSSKTSAFNVINSVSYVNQDIISLIHIVYINCEINNMMDLQILKTIRKLRS